MPDQPHTLKKSLGLTALTIYGIGNILGSGIYGLIGKAAGEMGHGVWLAFLAAMVAAALTGLSYASLGSRYPKAAGAAFITQHAFRLPLLAYVIGLVVMMSGLTSMATNGSVFAGYASEMLGLRGLWPAVLITAFILALAAVNFWGIRESSWVNIACTFVEVGGLLLIVAVALPYWGSVDYLDFTSPLNASGDLSMSLLLSGAVLVFFSFVGFEDLLNVSEEVKNPRRIFPIALILALIIATGIYLAVAISAVSVVNPGVLAQSQAPLADVMTTAAPWFNPRIFSAVAAFAVTNSALLNYVMGSRIVYGMSRQGLLPGVLGRLHPTRRTPHVAIAALALIALALALIGDIKALASATSLLLLSSFAVVNTALAVLKLRPPPPPPEPLADDSHAAQTSGDPGGEGRAFEVPLFVPLAGALVCAALVVSKIVTGLRGGESMSLVIAGAIVAVVTGLYFVQKAGRGDKAQRHEGT